MARWWQRLVQGASRRRKGRAGRDFAEIDPDTLQATTDYLDRFLTTRRGVEVWVESPTNFNRPSIVLIAHDGEWTRRVVPSVRWGHQFADQRKLASYDAGVIPYPQRMRDWNQRNKD